MATKEEERIGLIKIADEVIAVCVLRATLKTAGVHALSGGLTDNLAKNFLGKDSTFKGIKINQNEEGVVIDISIIVDYGIKIPSVAWDIQENVKNEVEHIIDSKVLAVNIHVTGVYIEEQQS